MASARFEHLLAGTAVALALALTPYASSAFAASEAEITAAVPMPESADLPPPSIKDYCPGRCRDAARNPPPPRRSPRLRSSRRGSPTPAAAETTNSAPAPHRRRQVQHRLGLGRHRDRRQASRSTGRRKIRPHPRRQEGARHHRGVLRQPRLRAALDRRRRDRASAPRPRRPISPASMPTASIRANIRCRRSRPAWSPRRWPKPRSSSPTRC